MASTQDKERGSVEKEKEKEKDKKLEVVTNKPQRRQWSSFDVGPPPPELDGDVELPQWQSKSFFGVVGEHGGQEVDDADVELRREEDKEDRRRSKVHNNKGDQCFRKLKENLADEGTKESLLQMAKDLLNG